MYQNMAIGTKVAALNIQLILSRNVDETEQQLLRRSI
jgi:hypothetical protein